MGSPKTPTAFKVPIDSLDLKTASLPALNAVTAQFNRDRNNRGSVFCQLERLANGTLILSGCYLEPEYTNEIATILQRRYDKITGPQR